MAHYFRLNKSVIDKDCYETPTSVLDMVLEELNPNKHYLFEPFPGTGHSTKYMRSKGFKVTNGPYTNFFDNNVAPEIEEEGYDLVVVTNPPFSLKKQALMKLQQLNVKRIAMLLPAGTLFLTYFDKLFPCDETFSIIIHRGRVKFLDPNTQQTLKGSASFDVLWCCGGLNLCKPIMYKSYRDYEICLMKSNSTTVS